MKNKLMSMCLISSLFLLSSSQAFSIQEVVLDNKSNQTYTMETNFSNEIHSKFTLNDCINLAINNNLIIKSSKIDADIHKTKIVQAWANYFPQLSAGIDWNRNHSNLFFKDAYNQAYLPQIGAEMLIFDFGKTKATADSAKRAFESKQFDIYEAVNVLICNVKKAYFNMLFAQAQCAVYEDTVADFELQKKQATILYEAGKKAKVDVAIANYNLCKAQYNYVKAQNTLKVSKYQLSRIMGVPEYDNYELISQMDKNIYEIDIEKAMQNAYKVRPSLLSYTKQTEAAKKDLSAARREFTPNISINGSYGKSIGTYNYNSYQFGVNMTYSAFNILKTKKVVDRAKLSYEKSKVDLENLKQDLYLNIKSSYSAVQTDGEAIKIAEIAMEQANEQYRQTKGRYKAGIADVIELKDGENAYLNSRLDYYNSILNYNISLADFEKEIGAPFKEFIINENE